MQRWVASEAHGAISEVNSGDPDNSSLIPPFRLGTRATDSPVSSVAEGNRLDRADQGHMGRARRALVQQQTKLSI